MIQQKNVVNGTIIATGNVHIGDNITYTIQDRFHDSHSVLFLRLDPAEDGGYRAMLSAKNAQTGTIDHLEQPVTVDIPASLFQQAEAFQAMRRQIGGTTRFGTALSMAPEQAEATLADLLYETFFTGEIGTLTGQFITLLQQRKLTELLLVISTDDDALLQLPWEMLLPRLSGIDALPPDGFGLIRSHLTTLDAFNAQGTTDRAAPLKVLFVSALPENMPEADKQLLLETELKELIAVSQHPTNRLQPPLVVEILDCANLTELTEALQKRSHDIVHISGHGAYLTDQQQGVLLMENEDGDQQLVTGRELGKALRPFGSVKLVVVSACESAAGNALGNVARQLADVGLRAVLAMRFSVTDEAARLLTRQFYGRLAAGDSLTKALHDTRQHLWQQTETRRQHNPDAAIAAEWFTPVLFQNQGIGPLIDRQRTYDTGTHGLFYPPLTFTRSQHTRLIGEDFIGRKRILIQLRKGFRQGQALCLHGMGGLGKTTTAEAFTNHYRTYHGNPPVLLFRKGGHAIEELSILTRLVATWKARTQPDALVADDLAALLDSPDVPTQKKLQAVIDNCLTVCPMILLFDNTEDTHDADGRFDAEGLRDFLRQLISNVPKHCHILFTTRYAINDLADCLTHLPLGKMTYAEQYRYVQSSDVLRSLTPAEQALLYERFDGLPRAFTFLVGILANGVAFNMNKVAKVESQLMENLLLGTLYQSLTDTEQTVFAQSSVLLGRTHVAVFAHVSEQPEVVLTPILRILKRKALCFGYDDDTFEIHPLTRAWLWQQNCISQVAVKDLSYKAANFYNELTDFLNQDLSLLYFLQAEAWNDFADLAMAKADLLRRLSYNQQALHLCNTVKQKPVHYSYKINAINTIASCYVSLNLYDEALQLLEDSQNIALREKDKNAQAEIYNTIGGVYNEVGKHNQALDYFQRSLDIKKSLGITFGLGPIYNNIGLIHITNKKYKEALDYLQKSLKCKENEFDRIGIPTTLYNIASTYWLMNRIDKAKRLAKNALDKAKGVSSLKTEMNANSLLGNIFLKTKQYDLSYSHLQESLRISQAIRNRSSEASIFNLLSDLHLALNQFEIALSYCQSSLFILENLARQKLFDQRTILETLNKRDHLVRIIQGLNLNR
ncbi:tetratricopeptide repeat protein [Fibrella sp. WM1]|uniref:tetratricopeptide repeat protein n=1 Tax=Fibrella musci TaxID=3242485 RepID=UPI00351F853B